jgi:hypothetical protein
LGYARSYGIKGEYMISNDLDTTDGLDHNFTQYRVEVRHNTEFTYLPSDFDKHIDSEYVLELVKDRLTDEYGAYYIEDAIISIETM